MIVFNCSWVTPAMWVAVASTTAFGSVERHKPRGTLNERPGADGLRQLLPKLLLESRILAQWNADQTALLV